MSSSCSELSPGADRRTSTGSCGLDRAVPVLHSGDSPEGSSPSQMMLQQHRLDQSFRNLTQTSAPCSYLTPRTPWSIFIHRLQMMLAGHLQCYVARGHGRTFSSACSSLETKAAAPKPLWAVPGQRAADASTTAAALLSWLQRRSLPGQREEVCGSCQQCEPGEVAEVLLL